MHLVILSPLIKSAVASLSQVMSAKSAIPVLENILLRPGADDKSISLTASDGDNMMTVSLPVEESSDVVPFLIPSDVVSYVRQLSDWPVNIDTDPDASITISDLMGEFSCVGSYETDVYPLLSVPEGGSSFEVPADAFLSSIKAALRFANKDDIRQVMCGVFCRFAPDGLRVAASNMKTLFSDNISGSYPDADASVIITRKLVNAANALFDRSGDPVLVSFDDKRVLFKQADAVMCGVQIEGRYPRYESIIPKNNDKSVVIDVALLKAAISRSMFSASRSGLFRLQFDGSESLVIETEDIEFSRYGNVKLKTLSQTNLSGGLSIGVRGQFLSDAISYAFPDCAQLTFLMSDAAHAVIVKHTSDDSRLALIMPMQLH